MKSPFVAGSGSGSASVLAGRPRARRGLLAPCIAWALLLGAAVPDSRADDLLQTWQLARRADPVLASADALRRGVRAGVDLARAPLLPQLSASATLEQSHADGSSSGDNRARGLQAALSQTLLDLAAQDRLRSAQAAANSEDASYRAAEQALLVRVARAYFEVLTAEDSLAAARANEQAFGQQVQQSSERQRNGLSAAVDVEQARAYHANARAAAVAAEQALADAREALSEITGQPTGRLARLREQLPLDPPAPADAQAWVDRALQDNPTLQAQRASVTAAEHGVDAARAGHWPTLGAALSSGTSSAWPQPASNNGRNLTRVGLVLNVPLFAGGATQAQLAQARNQREGAAAELERRRRAVAREVLQHHRGVLAGIEQTEATRAAREAAEKALASTRVGQGLGTQTMNELLQSIQTVGAAQNAHSRARHQFILSRLLLQQASGRITEADLAAVNTLLDDSTPR